MHHVRRKVRIAWPSQRAPLKEGLSKDSLIAERFEHASTRRMNEGLQINLALKAIVEDDLQPPRADDHGAFDVIWRAWNDRRDYSKGAICFG
jgi:hypothetical protein